MDRDGKVKVMDFGIARAGDSGMTEAGSILGTAQYLAPEQAQGLPVDARSDLYSVGIVLYEMLTGAVPFKGDTAVTVALKHVNEIAVEPASCPGAAVLAQPDRAQGDGQGPGAALPVRRPSSRATCAPPRPAAPSRAATFDSPPSAPASSPARPAGHGRACMRSRRLDPVAPDRGPKRRRWPIVLVVVLLSS